MSDAPRLPVDLLRRLPPTFGPSVNDQLRQWDVLFPAEQRRLRAQLEWLERLPRDQFDQLFAGMLDVESRMDLPRWGPDSAGLSVRDTGILARSPLYPKWRSEVEEVFGRIETEAGPAGELQAIPRLLVCILPPGVPPKDQTAWPDLDKTASRIPLDRRFGEMLPAFAAAVAKRVCPPGLGEVERSWVLDCSGRFAKPGGATVLSWEALGGLRRDFLRRFNTVARDLRSVDQIGEDLKRADIGRLLDPDTAAQPRVREFVRSLFLSGNGSLVFGNSFVQWGASEALRRVEPQVLFASFGFRQKLKPFSSVVLFEDQSRSNPVRDEDDPAGSWIDAVMLAQYTWLAAQRVACYRDRTLTIVGAFDVNTVQVLSPRPLPPAGRPKSSEDLTAFACDWLAGGI